MLKHDKCGKFEERITELEKEVQRLSLLLQRALEDQKPAPDKDDNPSNKIE